MVRDEAVNSRAELEEIPPADSKKRKRGGSGEEDDNNAKKRSKAEKKKKKEIHKSHRVIDDDEVEKEVDYVFLFTPMKLKLTTCSHDSRRRIQLLWRQVLLLMQVL
jgi:hypothetical protein